MKQAHVAGFRFAALSILNSINASVGQDFHTLRKWQVEELIKLADWEEYQAPKNRNGSRARYYYERLQRHARRAD